MVTLIRLMTNIEKHCFRAVAYSNPVGGGNESEYMFSDRQITKKKNSSEHHQSIFVFSVRFKLSKNIGT